MALTFADTHNMIANLTKPDISEGFDQIIDFLNASSIKYALTVNPNIYVSCIKQFWSSVLVKKVNDVPRLQALVDRKKVIITEAIIRETLRLDDAESIDCLPNEEIFTELSRMGYEKPSTKLTFYKAFFFPQWKAQVGDLSSHTTKYSSPTLTQKVFSNMIKVGKGFSKVETPLFEGMIVAKQVDDVADEAKGQEVGEEEQVESIWVKEIKKDEDVTLKNDAAVEKTAEIQEDADVQGRKAESQAQIYQIDLEHADKVLSMIMVEEHKPLKKQAQIEQDEAYARELEAELNKNINWDNVIEQVQRKEKEDNAMMREYLEVLWQLVTERFASSKPKNFSDDFLLTTLIYMFEKPDVQAQVWKSQKSVHGLAKVKS
nr:xylulose kinase-1 [Tanacetum cinerariifolium]